LCRMVLRAYQLATRPRRHVVMRVG
jgi:hypothetical protein